MLDKVYSQHHPYQSAWQRSWAGLDSKAAHGWGDGEAQIINSDNSQVEKQELPQNFWGKKVGRSQKITSPVVLTSLWERTHFFIFLYVLLIYALFHRLFYSFFVQQQLKQADKVKLDLCSEEEENPEQTVFPSPV